MPLLSPSFVHRLYRGALRCMLVVLIVMVSVLNYLLGAHTLAASNLPLGVGIAIFGSCLHIMLLRLEGIALFPKRKRGSLGFFSQVALGIGWFAVGYCDTQGLHGFWFNLLGLTVGVTLVAFAREYLEEDITLPR